MIKNLRIKNILIIIVFGLTFNTQVKSQKSLSTYKIGSKYIKTFEDGTYSTDTIGTVIDTAKIGKYGGWLDKKIDSTGYFHTKKIDSAWYLVDPEGYLFYAMGVTSIQKGGDINLPEDLKKWGLNLMGNWSDESISDIPYCPNFRFMNSFKYTSDENKALFNEQTFPVFDSEFAGWVDEQAESFVAPYVNDPWVFGYHTDNEVLFHYCDINNYLALSSTNDNYLAAYDWMIARKGAISPVTDDDIKDFRAFVAETYMSTVNNALKKYDPNHMNIGCRIHSATKYDAKLLAALGKHVDIMSINFYNRWQPYNDYMDLWLNEGNVPFLITEFYTKAVEGGIEGSSGTGWKVNTWKDRAQFFENTVLNLLSHPGSLGWTWFKYYDSDLSRKGIVDNNYKVYPELTESMQNISRDVYNLRNCLLTEGCLDDICFDTIKPLDPPPLIIHEIGLIQAEEYSNMYGIETETTTDAGGGLNVGWIDDGDWTEYKVDVTSSGTYIVDYRVASDKGGGSVQFKVDGNILASNSIPSTSGWQNWVTQSTSVDLSPGVQTIRLHAASGGWNINWFKLSLQSIINPPSSLSNQLDQEIKVYPNPANSELNINISGTQNAQVEILNIMGDVVLSNAIEGTSNTTLDINELSRGIYMVRISVNGRASYQKLLKN